MHAQLDAPGGLVLMHPIRPTACPTRSRRASRSRSAATRRTRPVRCGRSWPTGPRSRCPWTCRRGAASSGCSSTASHPVDAARRSGGVSGYCSARLHGATREVQGQPRLGVGHVDTEEFLHAPDPDHDRVAVQAERTRRRRDAGLVIEVGGERGEQLPTAVAQRRQQRFRPPGRRCRSRSRRAAAAPGRGCRHARTTRSRSAMRRCAPRRRPRPGSRGQTFRPGLQRPDTGRHREIAQHGEVEFPQ